MDRRRYEYALALTETLDEVADDLEHFRRSIRGKAERHPLLRPTVLSFEAAVRQVFERTIDPSLCHWRELARRYEDQMAAEARQLAPVFSDRVEQLRTCLRKGSRHG
jgi:hypothetical protein